MRLVGYADRFSAEPGESVEFMVSSVPESFQASITRLGDPDPLVAGGDLGEFPGRRQSLPAGSHARVDGPVGPSVRSVSVQLWLWPTTPDKDEQTLVALDGADGSSAVLSLRAGRPVLAVSDPGGATREAVLEREVVARTWYFLAASCDSGTAVLRLEAVDRAASELDGHHAGPLAPVDHALPRRGATTLAGPGAFYNGKLESPRVFERALDAAEFDALRDGGDPTALPGLLAAWDFSRGIDSTRVHDGSGRGLHGVTVQRPTRAVTGHGWDGSESSWRHAPHQYGAIHFHDDDLDDAGWEPSVRWRVPEGVRSGLYALRVEADGASDEIPFAVRPPARTATAPVLLLLPTYSYLAYANQHMLTAGSLKSMLESAATGPDGAARAKGYPSDPADRYIVDNRLNSLYDHHSDGSGVCYSSRALPIVTMRREYVEPALDGGEGGLHQFPADLVLARWLRDSGHEFDVATDEDLHREGADLLRRYRVVLTGTHHEYWSERMLDSLRSYLDGGGRLVNLTGNGFYWVTEPDPERGHTVEIRRKAPSTRIWESAPGEGDLSFTGTQGGLWRYRNRTPQSLVGVGFTAQGLGPGRPYHRTPESFDPSVKWVFEGLGDDEPIGDHPGLICGHGAAGFEIDRADHALGTPARAVVLASATGFSDSYQHCSEEIGVSDSGQSGSVNAAVRADMVLVDYPNAGAVFSVGSIAWCGALPYNGGDNTASRVTRNVLARFLR